LDVVWANRHLLWLGLQYTFKLFFYVFILGSALGMMIGVGLLYGNRAIRIVLRAYVDVIRGMPLIVTIFLVFYGPVAYGINFSPFQSIVAALTVFASSHMAEIVRGGVSAVPKGQTDAAKALGLTFWSRFRHIILPQAIPMMMGPWTNLAVDMFKSTSLAILVSQADFLFSIQKRASAKGHYLEFYLAAGIVYFLCCFGISRLGAWAFRRINVGVAS
jgi:polar amino acid transport system permease protein